MNRPVMNEAQTGPDGSPIHGLPKNSPESQRACAALFKWLPVSLVLCLVLLTGCARNYVITLTNGARITTTSKPKLQGPVYIFKDAKGQEAQVSVGRVREIAPASLATEEGSQFMR